MILKRSFFARPTLEVARELLGKKLVFGLRSVLIMETEAYIGRDDPACHAARGQTPRNAVMFGQPGVAYVYFIYGMYYCLNLVTEKKGFPAAVLIRGGLDPVTKIHYNGPGKLCRFLKITKAQNGTNVCRDKNFFLEETGIQWSHQETARIGIKKGLELPWRVVAELRNN
jgi:DNA-3-methyladenine glycosylase